MFNNIFAKKRCYKNSNCYCRNSYTPFQLWYFKKLVRQNMLMVHINKKFLISCFYLLLSCSYLYYIWLFPRLTHLSGDIKKDPGPLKDFSQTFSIGHWNLDSSAAHNFTKVALLKTYLFAQRFDIFCISETYLSSRYYRGWWKCTSIWIWFDQIRPSFQ